MIQKQAQNLALATWNTRTGLSLLLLPLSLIFSGIVKLRRFLYRTGFLKTHHLTVPVIIVGNISVGGTGKTPLVIYVANLLKHEGFKPGIISRGYGGNSSSWPQVVTIQSHANQVGDEALLIHRQTNCPMAVGPSRVAAATLLLTTHNCNVIISDDGLQHYALARDIEIAVIDGERRFGNGYCLPAGALREPVQRLQDVNIVVVNGEKTQNTELAMQLIGTVAINLRTNERKPLSAFRGKHCHAIAGIGNPERFFKTLASAELICNTHAFPDHYPYTQHDITFLDDKPVFMTEKDAVKCTHFANHQHWYLPVNAKLSDDFAEQLLHLLKTNHDR